MTRKALAVIAFIVIGSIVCAWFFLSNANPGISIPKEIPQAKIIGFTEGTTAPIAGVMMCTDFTLTVENTGMMDISNGSLTLERMINGSMSQNGVYDHPANFALRQGQMLSFTISLQRTLLEDFQDRTLTAVLMGNGIVLDERVLPQPKITYQAKIVGFTSQLTTLVGTTMEFAFNVTVENNGTSEIKNAFLKIERTVNGSISQSNMEYLDIPSLFTLSPRQIISFRIDLAIGLNEAMDTRQRYTAILSANGIVLDEQNLYNFNNPLPSPTNTRPAMIH